MDERIEDIIYQALNSAIACSVLEVDGDGRHFDALVVSDEFINKSRLERHRIIYNILGDRMKEQIHALSIKLYTMEEWENLNG